MAWCRKFWSLIGHLARHSARCGSLFHRKVVHSLAVGRYLWQGPTIPARPSFRGKSISIRLLSSLGIEPPARIRRRIRERKIAPQQSGSFFLVGSCRSPTLENRFYRSGHVSHNALAKRFQTSNSLLFWRRIQHRGGVPKLARFTKTHDAAELWRFHAWLCSTP